MIKNINLLIATFFGIGYIKIAPGTFASLVTCIILYQVFHQDNILHFYVLIILLILFFYSLYAIKSASKHFGQKDSKEIVIDEVIGQSIPIYFFEYIMYITPDETDNNELIYHPLGLRWGFYFILLLFFRIFDIYKPFPINWVDKKFKNSFGVLFDDILASVYTIITGGLIITIIIPIILHFMYLWFY